MTCRWAINAGLSGHRRRVAAGSPTFPPPDRSGVDLPWAIFSFPCCSSRVDHLTLSLGIRARGSASLRGVNVGSFRIISRIVTAAPSAGSPHDAGVAGLRSTLSGHRQRLRTPAEQAQRHRDRKQLLSALHQPALPTPETEPASPSIAADVLPLIVPLTTAVNALCVGQHPDEIPENSRLWPCSRPGCYVLFSLSPRSPHRSFCSCSCRQALRRVRQRETRFRAAHAAAKATAPSSAPHPRRARYVVMY